MVAIFKIPLATMVRKPAAIFLTKKAEYTNWFSVSLAFEGHLQHFNTRCMQSNLFFKYCQDCVFYRDRTCAGGQKIIGNSLSGRNSFYHPVTNRGIDFYNSQYCLKLLNGDPNFNPALNDVGAVPVNLPDYFLTSGLEYSYNRGRSFKVSYLRQDLIEEGNPDTLWNSLSLPFPNVFRDNADICLGNNRLTNQGDFEEIQNIFFNQIYNEDLFYPAYFKSSSVEDYFRSVNFEVFTAVSGRMNHDPTRKSILVGNPRSNDLAKKILPPIYTKICIVDRLIHLEGEDGNLYVLPLDLSGEPTLQNPHA